MSCNWQTVIFEIQEREEHDAAVLKIEVTRLIHIKQEERKRNLMLALESEMQTCGRLQVIAGQ